MLTKRLFQNTLHIINAKWLPVINELPKWGKESRHDTLLTLLGTGLLKTIYTDKLYLLFNYLHFFQWRTQLNIQILIIGSVNI
jgi:hypothetical protein